MARYFLEKNAASRKVWDKTLDAIVKMPQDEKKQILVRKLVGHGNANSLSPHVPFKNTTLTTEEATRVYEKAKYPAKGSYLIKNQNALFELHNKAWFDSPGGYSRKFPGN